MRVLFSLLLSVGLVPAAAKAPSPAPERAPEAAVRPVEDVYFGTRVVDPYRWMESPEGEELSTWLAAQNAYTRRVLDAPERKRDAWFDRILALTSGAETIRFITRAGDRFFYLSTPPDATEPQVMSRAVDGGERRVELAAGAVGEGLSIDFHAPSPSGRYVSVAVSRGGAEDWAFRIVDTKTGALLPEVVDRISLPFPAWAHDERGFYYSRLQPRSRDGKRASAVYDGIRVHYHALGTDPSEDVAVFGPGVSPDVELPMSDAFPDIHAARDGRWLVASHVRGVQYNAKALWVRRTNDANAGWRKVADYADEISFVRTRGDRAYVISSKDAPNGRLLAFDLEAGDFAKAKVVVPESDVVISADVGGLVEARDALYLLGQEGGIGSIRRIDFESHAASTVPLPIAGAIGEVAASHTADGLALTIDTPASSPRLSRWNSSAKRWVDTGLRVPDPADDGTLELRRAEVESTGGARVPVTIVHRKGLVRDGKNPTLMAAYGAYGAIAPTWFVPGMRAWYERGGVYVFVHARGGGEKGEGWHRAAMKVKKQATIDDVIAAARWLVRENYTRAEHLAIAGKSAGGIPAGGAITQAPELFGAALLRVAVTDQLRIEQSAGGPSNALEYGSVKIEPELRALLKTSPYANVRDGVAYPAVLLETGINDPRVPPWQLAKMTARLQAATSAKDRPILLRVDYDAGHGVGNDKRQVAALLADELAFLAWQLGIKGAPD